MRGKSIVQYNFWSGKIITSGLALFCLANFSPALGQIIPDRTLPVNSLVSGNDNTLVINDGTQAEGSLFHSFSEFSIPSGLEAYFNNASTVKNIISRVTGSTISNIDGLIRANGSANLFLLNPNGIIFGANASLDIGGSFLASTANSVQFADGSEFSATNPTISPLLTVTIPVGLQFRQNSGTIRVQGTGHNLELVEPLIFFSIKRVDNPTGLGVKPGKTLAIVGGNVDIEGGTITAEDGRIELGSVNSGIVSLNPTQVGLVEPAPIKIEEQESKEAVEKKSSSPSEPTPVVPTQGWIFNDQGEVVLVAYDPTLTGPQRLPKNEEGCPVP